MSKIEIIVERTHTGYSAYAKKHAAATTGKDLAHIRKNMAEASNLYFEEKPEKVTENDPKITLDLHQFFLFYKVINAKVIQMRLKYK